ncbi:hypothetical protein CJD50_22315 [Hafnia paralvei]|uniref:DUF1317 family protein n=1 Tax=Hafnia paralvei TaxID=546367 RepID=A0A2A2M6N3_9GAMM|nr:DUF1317 family protein [Hafnia paralvei]PAV94171.1 hypothetical protein CJD50_22315 [Hafnia paralvei]TBL55553.1 DUF1317 family protein [Hafnia paralvei]
MWHPHNDIRVGKVTIPYSGKNNGWLLPDNTFTSNPIKDQRLAEKHNAFLTKLARELHWAA